MPHRIKRVLALACAATSLAVSAAPTPKPVETLRSIALPANVAYPEGTAYDPASGDLFAGSAVDGALVRVNARSGQARQVIPAGRIVAPGSRFPAMLGMKLDGEGHLWIAGGRTGLVTIVDPAHHRIIAQLKAPSTPETLLNDLIFVGPSAYVTDTFVPMLWKVAQHGNHFGPVEPWLDLRGTPIVFGKGPNLNGIAATPDGKYLIVDQMAKGLLFRIDIATRAITRIDVGSADLTGGDGLTLIGSRLYVDRQWAGEIVTVALSPDAAHGRVIRRLKDPTFIYPADSARVGNDLMVVNAQFNHHDEHSAPVRPFSLIAVPLNRL